MRLQLQAEYEQAMSSSKREANGKVVEMVLKPMKARLLLLSRYAAKQGMEDLLHRDELEKFFKTLPQVDAESGPKRALIGPRLSLLHEQITELLAEVSKPHPDDIDEAYELVMKHLPHFVYYSNYGNLDSEIYLPHVIENLTRKGLGSKETAKARTLKVLFDFVRLSPKEIQELGEDEVANPNGRMTEEEIAESAKKRKERDVLLQSAGAELTKRFREWWETGRLSLSISGGRRSVQPEDGDQRRASACQVTATGAIGN